MTLFKNLKKSKINSKLDITLLILRLNQVNPISRVGVRGAIAPLSPPGDKKSKKVCSSEAEPQPISHGPQGATLKGIKYATMCWNCSSTFANFSIVLPQSP